METPRDLSDAELIAAHERTAGTPGETDTDALLAEIERRGLDI